MKDSVILLASILGCLSLKAQNTLYKSENAPRPGDKIIKERISYFDPGEKGDKKIWYFDHLTTEKELYELRYSGNDSLLTGHEHLTFYRYQMQGDSLLITGMENRTMIQKSYLPELSVKYPFRFGDRFESYFYNVGEYQHNLDLTVSGKSIVEADAEGMLIIGEDTLENILRVHTLRKSVSEIKIPECSYMSEDSVTAKLRSHPDSIDYRIANDTLVILTDTYRWYAAGYRYPVFETIENKLIRNGKEEPHFRTAFYYPPDEQYYTLPEDMENLSRREKIEAEKLAAKDSSENESVIPKSKISEYKLSGNKAGGDLILEYTLTESADVEIALCNAQGQLLKMYPKETQQAGYYRKEIKINGSIFERYVIRFIIDGQPAGEKIWSE